MRIIIFLGLLSVIVNGVGFGDSDEVKSVSAMEGESVTLDTDIVKQTDDLIVWTYGPNKTIVAIINGKASSFRLSEDERFRLGVNLNKQTGDLTISDVRTNHSGLYSLKISSNSTPSYKNFNLTVYARLPVPVITNSSSSERSSSLKCSVLCSVMNVSHDGIEKLTKNFAHTTTRRTRRTDVSYLQMLSVIKVCTSEPYKRVPKVHLVTNGVPRAVHDHRRSVRDCVHGRN
ncbi:hypothetical protein E1301_Tti019098 [Triplophysa tibetana]|uniref:Immunoglobulin domain-containing protein n=1 Tax=Triplophysa tibetana TaxID=1572043 RepID=A0A5A9NQU4_9TELE|nr:hypothetical protein E1301_Tti019098 [Triplophysa tibetana]